VLTALVAAALIAGLAGAWSPCGFSMVDTLAPHGYARRLRVTGIACAAFAAGALTGGVATFGGLALLGDALGAGGGAAVAAAVAALLAGAAGDAAGRRILPQVRRQVPESWRRVLPLPLAAGLYGVLLGLGFTTFVLSFSVYALAAACLALGDAHAGAVVGLAFAAGRIAPLVVLAPLQETARGVAVAAAMGERPQILRGIRAGGALALCAAALALALEGDPATAASRLTAAGTDPSAGGDGLAWQVPGGGPGQFLAGGAGAPQTLPGTDPALGPGTVVWRQGETLVLAPQATLQPVATIAASGAEEPAVSYRWVVWRAREESGDVLRVADLTAPAQPAQDLERVIAPDRLGRPALDGDRVVFHVARRTSSRIVEIHLPTRRRRVLRTGRDGAQLLNPSMLGGRLLHVSSSAAGQRLLLGPRRGRDRVLYSAWPVVRRDAVHEPGRSRHGAGYPRGRAPSLPPRPPAGVTITLWTTALGPREAFVTRLRRTSAGTTSSILRLPRG
jgi:hypothetical protein